MLKYLKYLEFGHQIKDIINLNTPCKAHFLIKFPSVNVLPIKILLLSASFLLPS